MDTVWNMAPEGRTEPTADHSDRPARLRQDAPVIAKRYDMYLIRLVL